MCHVHFFLPGDKRKALELYRKGAELLQKGISIKFDDLGPDCQKYADLQKKMRTNLAMVRDRLSILGNQ